MLRLICFLMMVLLAVPAVASEDFNGFPIRQYPLPNDLILHGWRDADYPDYRPQKVMDRHYKMDLSIVNDIREITATNKHRMIHARYRMRHSVVISGEGPTLPLTNIKTPFSEWHSLPILQNGSSLSLEAIAYFGSIEESHIHSGTTKEIFPELTYDQLLASTRAAIKHFKIEDQRAEWWLGYAKMCGKTIEGPCSTYVDQVELEIILKDAPAVTITFNYIPGC